MWDLQVLAAIKEIKKSILRKKIILSIIIENYSWYDKIFRYSHMFVAITTPSISFIDQLATGSTDRTALVTLILSGIVAGMIKIKDYLVFDKVKELSKQQSVKYEQLFQRIDRELRKSKELRQNDEEFIYWITREFNNIEIADPDLPRSLREKYLKICKDKGIPSDDDIAELEALMKENTAVEVLKATAEAVVDEAVNIVIDKADIKLEDIKVDKLEDIKVDTNKLDYDPKNDQNELANIKKPNLTVPNTPVKPNTPASPMPAPTLTSPQGRLQSYNSTDSVNSDQGKPTYTKQLTLPKSNSIDRFRPRSNTDEQNRVEYREKMKTLDTQQDLAWAVDRLNSLE